MSHNAKLKDVNILDNFSVGLIGYLPYDMNFGLTPLKVCELQSFLLQCLFVGCGPGVSRQLPQPL